MTPKNVLLIGGNGFLGRHSAAAFLATAESVSVLDRPNSLRTLSGASSADLADQMQYEGSITDLATVRDAIDASRADTIVVFASYGEPGLGLVTSAERDPRAAVEVNVTGLLNVLEAASLCSGVSVLWLSSTTVYGAADSYGNRRVTEDDHLGPLSTYAASKVLGEQLIRTYRSRNKLKAMAIRPTLVWGPGITYSGVQSGLHELVEAAAQKRTAAVKGSQEPWDLIYVKDAAAGIAWASCSDFEHDTILLNGYTASLDEVREAVVSAVPDAEFIVAGDAPPLGFPLVDDSLTRRGGFRPGFDLADSVADFLDAVKEGDEATVIRS